MPTSERGSPTWIENRSRWESPVRDTRLATKYTRDKSHLLTEDLQDGQVLDGLIVVNPFSHSPATFF